MHNKRETMECNKMKWGRRRKNWLTLHMFLSSFVNVFGMQIRIPRFVADVFIFNPKMIFPVLGELDEVHIELMHALENHGVVLDQAFFDVRGDERGA